MVMLRVKPFKYIFGNFQDNTFQFKAVCQLAGKVIIAVQRAENGTGNTTGFVNIAGMIAANVVRGDAPVSHWEELGKKKIFMLDVRDPSEYKKGHIDGAENIPLNDLRRRMGEIPKDQDPGTCQGYQRLV